MDALIWPLIRRVLIAAGSSAVGAGFATDDEITLIAGAVVSVLATGWSMYNRWKEKNS